MSSSDDGLSALFRVCRSSDGAVAEIESSLRDAVKEGGVAVPETELAEMSRIAADAWRDGGGSETGFAAGLKSRLGDVANRGGVLAALALACAMQGVPAPAEAGVVGGGWREEDIIVENASSVSLGIGASAADSTMGVYGGGQAIGTRIEVGGKQIIYSGGKATDTTIHGGGEQRIQSGGLATSTTVGGKGVQNVLDGGSALETTVSEGGSQNVFDGGYASGVLLHEGASQHVADSGTALGVQHMSGTGSASFKGPVKDAPR
jgi:autotransporter passenger strand-loop-strand repeat protein